jgi:predicted nuclease of predicted toxin-antitoxin system
MKFLIDMNLSPRWVPFLASQGFEAVHWSNIGPASSPDSKILEYADDHGYIVVTHDLDFGMLLEANTASLGGVFGCADKLAAVHRIQFPPDRR